LQWYSYGQKTHLCSQSCRLAMSSRFVSAHTQSNSNNDAASVVIKFVSMEGGTSLKASNLNKSQQLSTSGLQQIQYQSLKSNGFQQASIGSGIWFGTRGAEVQILSPRPFFSITYKKFWISLLAAVGNFENAKASKVNQAEFQPLYSGTPDFGRRREP
jgi:hypothetical protein